MATFKSLCQQITVLENTMQRVSNLAIPIEYHLQTGYGKVRVIEYIRDPRPTHGHIISERNVTPLLSRGHLARYLDGMITGLEEIELLQSKRKEA